MRKPLFCCLVIGKRKDITQLMKQCYFADYTIGTDAYKNIEDVCSALGKRALIIGGETALSKSEAKLKENMQAFDIVDTVIYGKECYKKRVEELYETYKNSCVNFVVGVGGGKAIDTSKCLADMLGVKVVTVPTIASTCAASSALSVVYTENHTFDGFWYFKSPAYHTFIDTEIIACAPDKYFRAGIGDTLAKFYEVEFSARGREKTYNDEMALSISRMCNTPLIESAIEALNDCRNNVPSEKFSEVALIILVSTGMVSMLINPEFNGALAHAIFYGLTEINGFEEKFLHGDVIGYTLAVQLMLDDKEEEAKKIGNLISKMGVETTLKQRGIDATLDNLDKVLEAALKDPDMLVVPYKITKEMIFDAIIKMEKIFGGNKI